MQQIISAVVFAVLIGIGTFFILTPKSSIHIRDGDFKKKLLNRQLKHERYSAVYGKKLNIYDKFRIKSENVLKASNSKLSYGQYLMVSLGTGFFGALVGVFMKNYILMIVMFFCLAFMPMLVLIIKSGSYSQYVNSQVAAALSIVTNAYMQSDDIVSAIRENTSRMNNPIRSVFEEFVASKIFIDSNIEGNIRKMQAKIDNHFFSEWCDTLVLCQTDRNLKYTLPAIVDSMSDVQRVQSEMNVKMYDIYKEHFIIVGITLATVPMMYVLNKEWFYILINTMGGKIIVAIAFLVCFLSTLWVIKNNPPINDL